MLKYMLDTNIIIYTMKNKPTTVREQFIKHTDQICISSITHMELLFGAENSQRPEANLKKIESFVARLEVLHYDSSAAYHTAQIRATLKKHGTPVGPYDGLIAGHARSIGHIVVTNNIKEFDRISGLRLENWST